MQINSTVQFHFRLLRVGLSFTKVIQPLFAALLVLFAMANADLPGTSGFVGEFMVIVSAFQAHFRLCTPGRHHAGPGGGVHAVDGQARRLVGFCIILLVEVYLPERYRSVSYELAQAMLERAWKARLYSIISVT
jgi:hypothetical protein